MLHDEKPLHDEEANELLPEPTHVPKAHQCQLWGRKRQYQIFTLLVGSIVFNIILVAVLVRLNLISQKRSNSLYAGLEFDTISILSNRGPYGPTTENDTARSILWETLDTSGAQVAIDKSWATSKRLPLSQDFPWDRSKTVYSVRGYHSIHCIRKLHRWITISYNNGTQLDNYGHILHCLDTLLQDIHCFADDTPMIDTTGFWGEGQKRQCRDWNKLKEWVDLHNACYSYVNETQGVRSQFDRYKWCPPGSPYAAKMRSTLGLPEDWDSRAPREIDSMPPYWEGF
ncbi:hypothetical protein ACMFMG_000227 [Clarireedia jacksonii]